ncbi:hypothetical protein V5E97_03290 [Singulisphaera sp. Ch08]|uniref:Transposase n=1 Tax=Singulisphaera sp. Ch08 TaxID=3120278 RepID=A0AAU7CJF1_9BACT
MQSIVDQVTFLSSGASVADHIGRPGFPPCSGPRSLNSPAWSRSREVCTSPIGAAPSWPDRRSAPGSSRRSTRPLSSLWDWWRGRRTPAHASWLNQSELLNNAFGGRYLRRGSWADRESFIEHVRTVGLEYNRLHAHPFEWTWTNQQMRAWFAVHST